MKRCVVPLVLVVLLSGLATPAGAGAPEGPRLAVVADDPQYGSRLITIGPAGEAPQVLVSLPASHRPSWSADGSLLALAATGEAWEGAVVAVANADGSGLRIYRHATLEGGEGDPILSPDGRSVFYVRTTLVVVPGRGRSHFGTSIWLLDLASGSVRQQTRWLPDVLVPSSISPDGSRIAVTAYGPRGLDAFAIDLRTGHRSLLAREALEPTYSPDGSRVAFVRWTNWRSSAVDDGSPPINELRIARVGGSSRSRLLLRSRGLLVWPSWDPSGSRLTFTSSHVVENGYSSPEEGDKLMALNADGTCLTRVLTDPDLIVFGSTWQPGLGREAGPLSC